MSVAGPAPILQVDQVSQRFSSRAVLKGVSLAVGAGEIYALLGPNGAGKTTLSRIVCGRLRPDAGAVRILGRDPYREAAARAALGLAPQTLALYPQLTVEENLATFAALGGLRGPPARRAAGRVMEATAIADRARSRVAELSGGLQRRVNIAAAMIAEPKLLVLDEPTAGVDLGGREAIAEALRRFRSEGAAVLLATHDLSEAGALADRAGFLIDGEKRLEGPPDALLRDAFGERMIVEVDLAGSDRQALAAEGLAPHGATGGWSKLTAGGYADAAVLAGRLQARGCEVREVRVRRPVLADLYARLAAPAEAAA